MIIPTIQLGTVTLTDPDTYLPVELTILKDTASGAIVGIDTSFLTNTNEPVYSPYNRRHTLDVDDECKVVENQFYVAI